jgi:hypothetical protein
MADVICIVDDEGNLHKLRNPDAFENKEILKIARKTLFLYLTNKMKMNHHSKIICDLKDVANSLKDVANSIGLELEP